MGSSLFTCLRDSILRQNVHDCFRTLQHPKLHLGDLLEPCHKEWYFVVLENNLSTITQCLDGACGDDETLARSLRVSVKLANAYARRELLLDHSLQRINTAIQRDDPIVTMSALIEHNDNMNGIARDLVGTLSVEEVSNSLKLRARVDLIHEELKAALGEKGKDLTYEEMLTVLRVLHRVIALNDAVSVRNESKIMPILLAKDALWENVVESNGDWGAAYFSRLSKARNEKSTETGRPSILSHYEIQRIINEVAEAKHFPCEASAALTMAKFEASTSANEKMTDASRACSVCAVKTCKYYLSRLNRSLAPGNEFVLWGWLLALRTTGCLSSVSAQLSSEHIDLYRRVLSTLHVDNVCSVRKALESAHKIHARALALGKALAEFNAFLQEPNDWEGLKKYLLGLGGKGLTPCNTTLRLNVERKHIEEYVEALIQVKISKTMGTLSKNTKALHDQKDCHIAENYGWLVTSLASFKDKEEKEKEEEEDDIYFYFNIKSLKLIWKPSYTTPEPTYLEPDLLNREEIEKCISQVNLGVPLQQTKVRRCISLEAFDLLDQLIRVWVVKQHHHEWNLTMSEGIKTVCENMSLFQGICRCQALWRGFRMRRRYKAYLQALRSPELQTAATRILHFIRSHRRRHFVKQTLTGLRRVLRCIRRFQALWRGFTLRRTLTASLALALNPMSQSACERPLVSLVRLCSSCLVPTQADSIYNFQLSCLQAAQSTADNAKQLVSLQNEIELSSKLLQLAEQMRREAVASKLRRPTLCFSSIALCGGSRVLLNNLKQSQISASEQVSQKYSGLLFLLYSEPDYLARLLIELPAHVLWIEKQEGVLETCKPSEFALRLERIILSFYNYGKRGGDEVSLTFLITRALHMQLHATSWNDIKASRGHFALRLAVAMTHVSHSTQGTAVRHLIPLLQDILIADMKRQEKESGPVVRMPEGDVSPSLLNSSRSDGSARKLESTNAVDGDAAMEVAVALSKEESEKRRMDATSVAAVARALSRTPSKVANVSWLVHIAERLFFALFEEGGGVTLPSSMLRLIREVFCLMRQLYPHQPIKDLLKFLGLHLFYRYIHSIILAPDAFTAIVTDSKKPSPTVERPQEIQRATLAGLSRLLCLVVENKGIASNTEVADQTQALNSLIKMWHVRFKTYLLNLIGNERRCRDSSAGKLSRQAEAWVGRLPCSKEVSTEASNAAMNVEKKGHRKGQRCVYTGEETIH
ncbi:Ras GTPase-activating-like protein IQGAP1 [Taenia solium]|eukprot:TsM_001093500 transcript=TsM_001093500 gene=TsM_001093500